jgi:hypothetical protein
MHTPSTRHRVRPSDPGTTSGRRPAGREVVGGFYLVMGGVHLGLVSADAEVYRHFADHGLLPVVRTGWQEIVMAHPAVWGLVLMAGELTLGTLLLIGGRAARWGWIGVIAFQVLLMVFGFGFWLWSVPALGVLVVLARRDLRVLGDRQGYLVPR